MKHTRATALLAFSASLLATAVSAAPSVFPTGVTRYDPQKAFNQYVIFSGADNRTHLIDMNGNEVKRWDRPGFPSAILDPKLANGERGHVLLQTADLADPGKLSSAGNGLRNQAVGELDWAGKTVWQWGDQAPAAPPASTTTCAGWPTATPWCWPTACTR